MGTAGRSPRRVTRESLQPQTVKMLRTLVGRDLLPLVLSHRTQRAVLSKCVHVQAESEGEKHIANVLRSKFDATEIAVRDVSGGCGAMYEISVESEDFKGKRTVQQHRLVTEALAAEVKEMHGLRIVTKIPDASSNSV